jgi:hypothetical protein
MADFKYKEIKKKIIGSSVRGNISVPFKPLKNFQFLEIDFPLINKSNQILIQTTIERTVAE